MEMVGFLLRVSGDRQSFGQGGSAGTSRRTGLREEVSSVFTEVQDNHETSREMTQETIQN